MERNDKMLAVLENGETVEIDTKHLFNNQYNTADGVRIFDAQISRIINDVRPGLGKCRFCGAIVKRGEEERHYSKREAAGCESCFWYRTRMSRQDVCVSSDGLTETTTRTFERYCLYAEKHGKGEKGECIGDACRVWGIEWFTPENTFFLRLPDGFTHDRTENDLLQRGFLPGYFPGDFQFPRKIGSYELSARCNDGKLAFYTVQNSRRRFNFRFEDGRLYVKNTDFGWKEKPRLENVPDSVYGKIKCICAE